MVLPWLFTLAHKLLDIGETRRDFVVINESSFTRISIAGKGQLSIKNFAQEQNTRLNTQCLPPSYDIGGFPPFVTWKFHPYMVNVLI